MSADAPISNPPSQDHGLPPVQPPSGQVILRLFLVPAAIVAILIGLFLVGGTLQQWVNRLLGRASADSRTAEQFLRDIDNTNPEVRWRAASDLAQVLLRKDSLAADVPFALALADRLQGAIEQSAAAEKDFAARAAGLTQGETAREMKKLEPDRSLISFLGASLGNCMIPIGAPLLEQLALQKQGLEPEALRERRRRAMFALATLGENLKRYDRLSDDAKDDIDRQLAEAGEKSSHSTWTKTTREYLQRRRQGRNDTLGVASVLEKCAGDSDPFLRELTALVSNFWHGTALEESRIESVLVDLAKDNGAGEDELEDRQAKNPESAGARQVTTRKGFKVQANATIALARRGSPRVNLECLKEMLDPDKLREIFIVRSRGSADKPDSSLVVLTLTNTLKALTQLHEKRPEMKLQEFVPLVDALTRNTNASVRSAAEETQLSLK